MSIQVPAVPEQTGLSNAAQLRVSFFESLLKLAQQSVGSNGSNRWQELRDRARILLEDQSFPTTRDEEWRFTDLSELVELQLTGVDRNRVGTVSVAAWVLPETEQSRLVFVDGVYAPELSAIADLPPGLVVGPLSGLSELGDRLQPYLAQQTGAEETFTALNTVGLADAAVIWVPQNQVVDTPLHLLFISTTGDTPAFSQPRCLVVAAPNSALTLLEEYVTTGEGVYFTNPVTEVFVEENAQLNHTRIQRDSVAAFHIGKTAIAQSRNARYTCNAINLGGKLSRHHLNVYPNGEQTDTVLNGLTRIAGEQLGDTHSAIALSKPYCTTNQIQKCIVSDRAHAVFNGKVFVPKTAQLTDAKQLNRNLLLSSRARVDTKPQLEIVADNVKCTHGATVSQLDADEVFYLQSRGIDATSAQKLLVYAFAYEILDQIPIATLKQRLLEEVKQG